MYFCIASAKETLYHPIQFGNNNYHQYRKRNNIMQTVKLKKAKQNLEQLCEQVCINHEPYILQTDNEHDTVIISLEDYNSLQETNYLLSNPYNAQRLLKSLEKARSGKVFSKELIEE